MQSSTAAARFSLIEHAAATALPSFGEAVRAGLTHPEKHLPCRFLYDEEGSRLFEEICELPEYYLTRAEREILEANARSIADCFSTPAILAELGSGSSAKTRLLIDAFLRRHGSLRYVPVDISRSILEESALELLERYDALEIRAIASEYQEGLRHFRSETGRPKLVVWLGSTIGNLARHEAANFLRSVRPALCGPDRLLIGIDLRKDRRVLELAYDDPQGVTARFSLNLLERINRELGANFDPALFRHRAEYLADEGRVAIHVVSRRRQRVRIDELDLEVDFDRGEALHIEDSHKYSLEEIDSLAARAGMSLDRRWLDSRQRFSLNLLSPVA